MQLLLKQQCQESTKGKEETEKGSLSGLVSDEQRISALKIMVQKAQDNQSVQQSSRLLNQLATQSKATEQSSIDGTSPKTNPCKLKNKTQYIQSIRKSYMVLGDISKMTPKIKNKDKLLKQSFQIRPVQNQQHRQVMDQNIKQVLKAPFNIDPKKSRISELSEDLQIITNNAWEKCCLDIDLKKQQLLVADFALPFVNIRKVKIFRPDPLRQLNQIKLTYRTSKREETLFLNPKGQRQVKKVPSHFLIFEQILVQKLRFENNFKITKWQKTQHVCEQVILGSYIFGQIYKKSQHLGKWQKRYIILNNKGVFSYKSGMSRQDYTFCIQKESIQYMWTRFDLINDHLVIKLKHGLKKTEFGIPIANFSYPHYKNWLYYFYRLTIPAY